MAQQYLGDSFLGWRRYPAILKSSPINNHETVKGEEYLLGSLHTVDIYEIMIY
jgi:hypothetical protein